MLLTPHVQKRRRPIPIITICHHYWCAIVIAWLHFICVVNDLASQQVRIVVTAPTEWTAVTVCMALRQFEHIYNVTQGNGDYTDYYRQVRVRVYVYHQTLDIDITPSAAGAGLARMSTHVGGAHEQVPIPIDCLKS